MKFTLRNVSTAKLSLPWFVLDKRFAFTALLSHFNSFCFSPFFSNFSVSNSQFASWAGPGLHRKRKLVSNSSSLGRHLRPGRGLPRFACFHISPSRRERLWKWEIVWVLMLVLALKASVSVRTNTQEPSSTMGTTLYSVRVSARELDWRYTMCMFCGSTNWISATATATTTTNCESYSELVSEAPKSSHLI